MIRPLNGFSLLLVVLGVIPAAFGQAVVHDDTLVLIGFDGSVQPDFARGNPHVTLRNGELLKRGGRFAGGLLLSSGGALELTGNDGNLVTKEGTIEFWIKPSWAGGDAEKHSLFSARVSEHEYININTLGKGKLGIAMAAEEGDGFRWRRADGDARAWKPGTWHHVAFAWGGGKLSVFLDGVEDQDDVDDSLMLRGLPEKLTLIGADAVVDDFQIHSKQFTQSDAQQAIQSAVDPPVRLIDTLSYDVSGPVQSGGMSILGDVVLPLALGQTAYSRGFSFGDGAFLQFTREGSARLFQASVGVSMFASVDTECQFEVWGDDKPLFVSEPRRRDDAPLPVHVDVQGVKQIRLTVHGTKMRQQDALWIVPRLEKADASFKLLGKRKLTDAKMDMYRRQLGADDYDCQIRSRQPWILAKKHWADDVDPSAAPQPLGDDVLHVAAAPGEYEPFNFLIYAVDDMKNVRVLVSNLTSGKTVIPADACDVRLVLRRLMRDVYTKRPEQSTVVSRFLLPNQPVDIPAKTFREYHVIVHVPAKQSPGDYKGTVTIRQSSDSRPCPIRLTVRPIQLGTPEPKTYGMYYRFPNSIDDWSGIDRELTDIYEHGGRMLKSNLGVSLRKTNDGLVPDVRRLRHGLQLLAQHQFEGPMPVTSGAETASRLLRYDPVADYEDEPARKAFFDAVAKGMQALDQLSQEYPQFEFMPTHMDEVFGEDRLPRYIRLTEAVRQATKRRVYITIHNDPKRHVEPLMQQLDPFVDIRCFNGHCMDNWLQAGHTFADLDRELKASGDEAWLYHNIRGSFFPAEWTRLVNGFYLWLSPIRVHVPWMYYSYQMNPMDSTDGSESRGGDFAYAVPDPDDATAMIPTRHWEAYREGVDDMRYLRTLERLIGKNADRPAAKRAQRWLDALRNRLTPSHTALEQIKTESPFLVYLAGKFDGEDYLTFRNEAAALIAELQQP